MMKTTVAVTQQAWTSWVEYQPVRNFKYCNRLQVWW